MGDSSARLTRARRALRVIGLALGIGLVLGGMDASARCVDRPCQLAPRPHVAHTADRAGLAAASGFRAVLPLSLRGATAGASTFAPISLTVPAVGTVVATSDQAVALTLPAGFVDGVGSSGARLDVMAAAAPETESLGGVRAVRIDLTRPDGSAVTQLQRPIDIAMRYTTADLARAGVAAADLEIRYSRDGTTWGVALTTIDAAKGEARASVDHLTTFALVGRRTPGGFPVPTALPSPTPTGTWTPPSSTALPSPTPTGTWTPPSPTATAGPTTATPTPTATPLPALNPRRGVAIGGSSEPASVANVLEKTASGVWYTYVPGGEGPGGRVQMLRTGRSELPNSRDTEIQSIARARPGSYWIIGNEGNVADQDWDSTLPGCADADACFRANVANYVAAYKRYRGLVLAADTTAKFVVGNTLNFSSTCGGCVGYPLGRAFLDGIRNPSYWPETGGEPPVDVWGFHAYRIAWDNPPMADSEEPKSQILAFRRYLDAIPAQAGKPIWLTEFGVIWGFQDWCFVTDTRVTDAVSNDCTAQTGKTVTPRYDGQAAAVFPFAADQVDAYVASLAGWLTQNAVAYNIDRWFIFTDYGFPDPYTGVYGGISLMDATGAGARLTRYGRTYASAR